ncbi:response regulator [Enterorhabdus mucosicola]|uniref:Circadian input-output histidine kinase CikA n=1 Tax=Adlercreutzia mucosicola TaxID=580026 RepID=A0A6N8JMK0_9ACTN|nr:ATP-binding protein [Adlercreutzia mucosicola]MVX61108.1 response regulator [Adlercreutzia mucosicola]
MRQRFDSRAIFAAVAAVVAVLAVVVIVTGLRYFSTIHELVVQADSIMPNDEAEGAAIVRVTARMVAILVGSILLAVGAIAALLAYRSRRERRGERYVQNIYRVIGANIDTAIFIVDRADNVVEAVFENIQDILGVPATQFFAVDDLSSNEAYAKVAAIVHSGAPDERHLWEFQCFNSVFGRNMWLRITSQPVLLDGDEKVIYSLVDVTADYDIRQKLMDSVAAAEEANRAKSHFLSSMSHDIRTPMNAILGFSTLIDRDAENPEAVREYNRKIATSGQHLLGLINDVLDMSKIESGKTTLAAAEFRLPEVVASVEAMMRPQTNAKHQAFTVEVTGVTHEALVGDEGRLRQILMNVLSNAMKYTPDGGSILFRIDGSLKRRGSLQHLRIIVKDTGIGMSPDYLATIFDSFSREESSLTNKIQGTGLGMAITKNLVDLMGGTITVESTLGAGSTFIIDLDFPPADESAGTGVEGAPAPVEVDADAALGGRHFLVAEDNDLNAEIIAAILGMHGATCEIAENGQAAVEKFAASRPGTFDMIFMDVQMPVMNGHEAARAIRALEREDARDIPIIAMTANAFAEDEREALAAGMNAHVAKPIDLRMLARTVAGLTYCP